MKRATFTMKDVQRLKDTGKIRSFTVQNKAREQAGPNGKVVSKLFKKRSKEKAWIAETLLQECSTRCLILKEELKFHPERRWRFDWAIEDLKVAIEYEGIFSQKSRHTTAAGFSGDTTKYNEATRLGWKVLRYTATTYKNLQVDMEKIFQQR